MGWVGVQVAVLLADVEGRVGWVGGDAGVLRGGGGRWFAGRNGSCGREAGTAMAADCLPSSQQCTLCLMWLWHPKPKALCLMWFSALNSAPDAAPHLQAQQEAAERESVEAELSKEQQGLAALVLSFFHTIQRLVATFIAWVKSLFSGGGSSSAPSASTA